MKTGNDLVAEQVLYSTCFCYLPYRANQRNFAVLQRVAFYLRYSSIGCIDSFLSKYWIDVLEPGSKDNWIDVEQIKASTLCDENRKQDFAKVLENVDEDSNPILMIATLK